MSVRRLAEDAVQPEGFKFNRALGAEAKVWIKKYPKGREQSAVIPLLMLAQEQEGWVTKASIEHIAEMLNMPLIRVMEVATFYTQFMLQPVGTKAHIQVCGTTPCMLRGSEELMAVCKSKISPNQFELNEEGTLSWEEVECQGACVNAPMVMVFKDTYEDLTPERLEEIIDAFEAGNGDSVKTGPQIDRIFSAPAGGMTTLIGKPVGKSAKAANSNAKAKTAKSADKPTRAAKPKQSTSLSDGTVKSPKENRVSADSVSAKNAAPAPGTAKKAATAETTTAKKPATKSSATTKPAAAKGAGPERLSAPQGVADDLKLISGVGPKLEQTLNGLGFWHFSQIAKWKKSDVAIVDDELSFKGRIERDDWIKQAKALAKGREAEYIKVFGKKPR